MKKVLSILTIFMVLCMVSACGSESRHEGESNPPSDSSVMDKKNFQDVVEMFEKNGFSNVETEEIEDFTTDWLTKDGESEDVFVDSNTDCSADEWVTKQSAENDETRYAPQKKESMEDKNTQNTTAKNETVDTNEEVLNIDNSSDLSAILSTKNEFDPLIKQFAYKYQGKKIEFDGYTANVARNKDYKTRFNYLIYVGDYNSSSIVGPQFQIKDVNYYDLHLEGNNVPDTFGVGLNIHIVAEVVSYNESSGLFQIKPVKITIR